MDTAQQSTISEAEIRRIAGAAALWLPESHRPDAASRAFFRIRDKAVDQEWESDKHRLNWAKMVARNAVRDYAAAMHLRVGKLYRAEMPEDIEDDSSIPAAAAERAEEADSWAARRKQLRAQIRRLPNGLRGLAFARWGKGQTIPAIAENFGYGSETPVANRLKLAAARLRAGLGIESECAKLRQRLSPRENEVLSWVAADKTDKEIAAILGVSESRVNHCLDRAFKKLGVTRRVGAVLVYLKSSDKNL